MRSKSSQGGDTRRGGTRETNQSRRVRERSRIVLPSRAPPTVKHLIASRAPGSDDPLASSSSSEGDVRRPLLLDGKELKENSGTRATRSDRRGDRPDDDELASSACSEIVPYVEERTMEAAHAHAKYYKEWAAFAPVDFMKTFLKNGNIKVRPYSNKMSPVAPGVVSAHLLPFPDTFVANCIRNMPLDERKILHEDCIVMMQVMSESGSSFGTANPCLVGQAIHLSKYDRSDPPPPARIQKAITRFMRILPLGRPSGYYEQCRREGHVETFKQWWGHVLDKSAGVCGEIKFGKAVNKGTYLCHEDAEDTLDEVLEESLLEELPRFPMRAAGRGKPLPRKDYIDALFDITSSIDRLIWISGVRALHVVTDATTRLSRGLKAAGVASYGLSPYYGGASAIFARFGYLGSPRPTHMAKKMSRGVVTTEERRIYARFMDERQDWMVNHLFGSGTDVKRMDSSMRAWYIEAWAKMYKNDGLTHEELRFARRNLFLAHSGGDLLLGGRICAEVPEGATTGAAGVSTLESTYRWATDLLGVVLNVQLHILQELKYFSRIGKRRGLPYGPSVIAPGVNTVDGLACHEVGTGWLNKRNRCFRNPRGQLEPVSRRMVHVARMIKLGRGRNVALFPPTGPGTALFEALIPIVSYYFHCIVNGDDDWNTFPLGHLIPTNEWHLLLSADARMRWLNDGKDKACPLGQGSVREIIGQVRLSEAFARMRLPTILNEAKGVEGEGLACMCFNSMRPVVDGFGNWSFAIKGMTGEDEFRAITHPDEKITRPEHSCLRLIGLALLNPDPRAHELLLSMYQSIIRENNLILVDGKLDLTSHMEHCRKEKNNVFYHLGFEEGEELNEQLRSGKIAFPLYSRVLSLHGLPTELYSTGSTSQMLQNGAPRSPGW